MTIMRNRPSGYLPWLKLGAVSGMVFLQTALPSFAVEADIKAREQADQINRTLSQDALERQQQMLREMQKPPGDKKTVRPKPAAMSPQETCIDIRTIKITGAKIISQKDIGHTTTPFANKCVGLTELNNLLQALTYLYIERGYVAARAYLPEQDLSDGSLDINIVEGKLEAVVQNGGSGTAGQIATAFPGLTGKPVNLRHVEQGLDQINRLSSNKATIALQAGKTLGDTVLGVTIKKGKPWNAGVSSDNLGSAATGLYRTRLNFGLDSPLGLNDQWQFSYQRSMDRSPVFLSGKRPNSDTVTAAFSIPYGAFTFGIDGSWSQYHSLVEGQFSQIETEGGSLSVSPYLSWLFHRDQISKTWITGKLDWKSNDNFILGSRIDVSSRILTVGSLELGHSRQFLGGVLSASFGVQRGLKAFGAFDDATAPSGSPKGQFAKGTASLGFTRSRDIGAVEAIFNTTVSGQWSSDPLFSSEQMALGGASTVRGVREAALSASNALLIRNEISFLLPAFEQPELARNIGRLEPYVGVDFGRTIANTADGSLGGNMTGGAIGLRNRGGRLNFDLSWSRVFEVSPLSANTNLPKGIIQARISTQF